MTTAQSEQGNVKDTLRARRSSALRAVRAFLLQADSGTLARLRRSSPSSPPPDFFRVSVGRLDDVIASGPRERDESRWALIVKIMAMAMDLFGDEPFGEALARARVAERRVLQLLEAGEEQLVVLARQVVSQLVSKGQSMDLTDLADLVLDHGTERAERARRKIARNFYEHYEET